MEAANHLMRSLPATRTNNSINDILDISGEPEWAAQWANGIERPALIGEDAETGKKWLKSEYNSDGDAPSYRSPYTNVYEPPFPDGMLPTPELRAIEMRSNELLDLYHPMYYESAICSAYVFAAEGCEFGAAWLIKQGTTDKNDGLCNAGWDGFHVFEVSHGGEKSGVATYKLLSEIDVQLESNTDETGSLSMSYASDPLQVQDKMAYDEINTHAINMATMVEAAENTLRAKFENAVFDQTDNKFQLRKHLGKACVVTHQSDGWTNMVKELEAAGVDKKAQKTWSDIEKSNKTWKPAAAKK